MSFERIRYRLHGGKPLVVDSDTVAALRGRGVEIASPGALGLMLRERPAEALDHYRAEVASRVDVLSALTSDTTPRALAEVGMEHRAAQLTRRAVELALEAAAEGAKPVAVAGVLGSDLLSPVAAGRLREEFEEHAQRLAAAGCELLLVRGPGSRLGLLAAVTAASASDLPTWAIFAPAADNELVGHDGAIDLVEALAAAGASALLFEAATVALGSAHLERFRSACGRWGVAPGVLLAGSAASVPGFDDDSTDAAAWAERAVDLSKNGARVIGGGAGTTEAHTRSLALTLGALHPSLVPRL